MSEAYVLRDLAKLYESQGRWDDAKRYARERVELCSKLHDTLLEGSARLDLARLEATSGDLKAANEAFDRAGDESAAEAARKLVDDWKAKRPNK